MAAQIHIAGSTWIRVSRQLVNSSFTPSKSIAKAPTARARGASHRRERLSRSTMSSTTAWSLSLTAWINRSTCARVMRRRAGDPPSVPAPGKAGWLEASSTEGDSVGGSGAFPSIATTPFTGSRALGGPESGGTRRLQGHRPRLSVRCERNPGQWGPDHPVGVRPAAALCGTVGVARKEPTMTGRTAEAPPRLAARYSPTWCSTSTILTRCRQAPEWDVKRLTQDG